MKATSLLAILCTAFIATSSVQAVSISTVPVGNPGNPPDTRYLSSDHPSGVGSVSYPFRIGKTEVTNAQYVEFLNAVAASDQYALFDADMTTATRGGVVRTGSAGSYSYAVKPSVAGQGPGGADYTYADKPIVYVTWYDSIRFANWLHNGQGSGDTESGAYTLLGGSPTPSNGNIITRNPDAKWWLPSEDEWYKAAYHKNDGVTGNYWDYPTGTNSIPNHNPPSNDTGNSANFSGQVDPPATPNSVYPMTDVGAYTLSGGPYGTFDQGGNVSEWNETLGRIGRGLRGGRFNNPVGDLHASEYEWRGATFRNFGIIGFRVASIPEPASMTMLLFGLYALILWRRRR